MHSIQNEDEKFAFSSQSPQWDEIISEVEIFGSTVRSRFKKDFGSGQNVS